MNCVSCRTALSGGEHSAGYCNPCYKTLLVAWHDQCVSNSLHLAMKQAEITEAIQVARDTISKLRVEALRCGLILHHEEVKEVPIEALEELTDG